MHKQTYRPDIDCLRFMAVALVILFHCQFSWLKGGFIGVDIFFVISGFVMYRSCASENFLKLSQFALFYKKRLFRIYPVLLLTLFLTTLFAMLWLSTQTLDFYGKQLFFASLSLSNILFSNGLNYFSTISPLLLHTWSLSVEMQFYILFPFFITLLTIIKQKNARAVIPVIIIATLSSFIYAQLNHDKIGAFYLLQNRLFEFMIGILLASIPIKEKKGAPLLISFFTVLILGLITLSSVVFRPDHNHPGFYTLAPTLLAASFIILFSCYPFYNNRVTNCVAYLGRISYGIYLFHFPVSVFGKEIFQLSPEMILLANIVITLPLAHISYRYFETPIRRYGYKKSIPYVSATAMIFLAVGLAGFGYITAKTQGWPQRMKVFNPYAYDIAQMHKQNWDFFERGLNIKTSDNKRALFVGDSLMQNYITPLARAYNLKAEEIDSITRGGCLLLKGVDFKDTIADISCEDLRNKLYENKEHYEFIFISQDWHSYQTRLINKAPQTTNNEYEYIAPFISHTITALSQYAEHIILIGKHPTIGYNALLEVSPTLTKDDYQNFKESLHVKNIEDKGEVALLDQVAYETNAEVIHPIHIFCENEKCTLSDDAWAFFYDSQHLTQKGQEHAERYFKTQNKYNQ